MRQPAPHPSPLHRNGPVLAVVGVFLLVQLATIGRYGYFRDELYYLACADHPAWGYVDHPPLSVGLLWLVRAVGGDSLIALRILPILTGVATIGLTARTAREMGGRRGSELLAATAAAVPPIYLFIFHYFSMNCFDILIWTATTYLLTRIITRNEPRLWPVVGLLLGLGLLNKISVLWLGAGIAAGLILTDQRRQLGTKWPWIAGAIAGTMFLPYVFWQVANQYPTLEFIRNATQNKMAAVSPGSFIKAQIEGMNPATLPIWLGGLTFVLFSATGKKYRLLGILYVTVFLILILNEKSRANYLSPAYPMLFAAGSVAIEGLARRFNAVWLTTALCALVAAGGVLLAPATLPILPVEGYLRYAAALGIKPGTEEKKEIGKLPQHFADMFGWVEKAEAVGRAFKNLTPEEQAHCAVFGRNYGQAGAYDLFGKKYGLPPAISGHNTYWLWGTGGRRIDVLILLGGSPDDLNRLFESVEQVEVVHSEFVMPYENDLPVHVCRRPREPIEKIWPAIKHYD